MDTNQQNDSQTFQDYRTRIGHYNSLTDALADAVLRGNLVWRICDGTDTPFNLAEIYRFAEKYDKENPITGTEFYRVTREGAIGISMGLEYRVKWLFVPMEPGLERDAIIHDMGDGLLDDSDFAEAAKKAAALAPSPSAPVQSSQPAIRYFMLGASRQKLGPFTIDKLLANGLTPTTQVWTEGMPQWMRASDVALLADALAKRQTPAPIPAPPIAPAPAPAHVTAPPAIPAPQPAVKYRIYVNNQQYGPFTVDELIRNGVTPSTLVWTKGMPGWAKAADVPQIAAKIRH